MSIDTSIIATMKLTAGTAAVAFVLCAAASAQTPGAPAPALSNAQAAAIFGSRETVLNASLSPDGTMVALVEANGPRGSIVRVADLTGNATGKPIAGTAGDPERMNWCRWSGARRLLCNVYGMTVIEGAAANVKYSYMSRLMAIDADGKGMQMVPLPQRTGLSLGWGLYGGSVVDWNTGQDGHVLMVRAYVPESTLGTRLAQTDNGLGVDNVSTSDLRVVRVERPKNNAEEYISDGVGHVRVMGYEGPRTVDGYSSGKTRYLYRLTDKTEWQSLGDYDWVNREGFNPHRVDPTLNVAYGLKKVDGRLAAYAVSLDGRLTEQLILARPDVDVDGFVTIGRNRRVIGVTYSTDRREVHYIDPEFKRLAASLSKALPNLPLVNFVDSSQDERKLLIWAGSDVDPGRYYFFDRDTRALTQIAFSRSLLSTVPLGEVKSVQVKAADGTMIPAYLTLPPGSNGRNLPAIVMPHGGPSARDEWGFDWLAQYWANRGYAVLQPNFRGSEGYGDAWFENNGFQSWRTAIGDVTDSGKWLVEQGIADPKKLAIVGWSYGGYAALQSTVSQPDLFRAVIAIAPVTDLGWLKEDASGYRDFLVSKDFIGSGPHIEEGSPARHAAAIKAPVLMFHGTYDTNVTLRQSQLMANRLDDAGKPNRLVIYDKLTHSLDDSAARQDMLSESATFLEQSFAAGK